MMDVGEGKMTAQRAPKFWLSQRACLNLGVSIWHSHPAKLCLKRTRPLGLETMASDELTTTSTGGP